MRVSKAVKVRMAGFLVMWFSGQLTSTQLLAQTLEELADFVRYQDTAEQVNQAAKNPVS